MFFNAVDIGVKGGMPFADVPGTVFTADVETDNADVVTTVLLDVGEVADDDVIPELTEALEVEMAATDFTEVVEIDEDDVVTTACTKAIDVDDADVVMTVFTAVIGDDDVEVAKMVLTKAELATDDVTACLTFDREITLGFCRGSKLLASIETGIDSPPDLKLVATALEVDIAAVHVFDSDEAIINVATVCSRVFVFFGLVIVVVVDTVKPGSSFTACEDDGAHEVASNGTVTAFVDFVFSLILALH